MIEVVVTYFDSELEVFECLFGKFKIMSASKKTWFAGITARSKLPVPPTIEAAGSDKSELVRGVTTWFTFGDLTVFPLMVTLTYWFSVVYQFIKLDTVAVKSPDAGFDEKAVKLKVNLFGAVNAHVVAVLVESEQVVGVA